jgi:hypothetical protein
MNGPQSFGLWSNHRASPGSIKRRCKILDNHSEQNDVNAFWGVELCSTFLLLDGAVFACWNLTDRLGLLLNAYLSTRSFNSDRDIKWVVIGVDGWAVIHKLKSCRRHRFILLLSQFILRVNRQVMMEKWGSRFGFWRKFIWACNSQT